MKKTFNIYHVTIQKIHLSERVNIFTDSIDDARTDLAVKYGVPKSAVLFKIKHLKEKWNRK